MTIKLNPEQEDFIARACAFIDSKPSRADLDRLLTLATLQLPEPAVAFLRRRAAAANDAPPEDPPRLQ